MLADDYRLARPRSAIRIFAFGLAEEMAELSLFKEDVSLYYFFPTFGARRFLSLPELALDLCPGDYSE